MKRSSRAGDLKKGFKVKEMSSISTLESCVGALSVECLKVRRNIRRKMVLPEVAKTNKLELLKWREKKRV